MNLEIPYSKVCNGKETGKLTSLVMLETKSLLVAYVLWLFGGFFGLHHLYLRRDGHAFFMFCTLGGYLGFGWITDVFYMPEYVRQFNTNALFLSMPPSIERPNMSAWRVHSQIVFSLIWGLLTDSAIPSDYYHWLHWTIPLTMSLAVWNMGNVGRHCGVWKHCAVAAFLTYGLSLLLELERMHNLVAVSIISSFTFTIFSSKWRRKPCSLSLLVRLLILSMACCVYLLLWWSYLYYNAYIVNSKNEPISFRALLNMFRRSDWWHDLKLSLTHMYNYGLAYGWLEVLEYDRGFGVFKDYGITFLYSPLEESRN